MEGVLAMSKGIRFVVRAMVAVAALAMLTVGSAAYAYVEPPGGGGDAPTTLTAHVVPSSVVPVSEQIGWMVSGALIVLVVAAIAMGATAIARQVQTR